MRLSKLFGRKKNRGAKRGKGLSRSLLRLESLEPRQLLSITPAEYSAICSEYAEFSLPAQEDLNIIEITAGNLTASNLQSAIDQAVLSVKSDLILLRTTETVNRIDYASANDGLVIDLDSDDPAGAITIIAWGDAPLTIDANGLTRVLSISSNDAARIAVNLGNLTLTDGNLSGNAGGLYSSGTVIGKNLTISDNHASLSGGGIYNQGALTLIASSVVGNSATENGGGIYLGSGSLTTTGLIVSGNNAANGGGIYNATGTISSTNDKIYANHASFGAGVYLSNASSTFTNGAFYGNRVMLTGGTATGGGFYLSGGDMTLVNMTVTGNIASSAGGIFFSGEEGELDIYNSIISLNKADSGANIVVASSDYASSNSLIDASASTIGFVSAPTYLESGELDLDALNIRLTSTSSAIDIGNNLFVEAGSLDLDGNDRIYNNIVDIGGYEYYGESFTLESITLSENAPSIGTTLTTTLSPSDATATYQWYRGTSSAGMTPISGAIGSSYSVTSSDAGNYLMVIATGTGNYSGTVSATTTSVVPERISLTGITLSTSTPEVGTTITSALSPTGATATYQWYRGNSEGISAIPGAISSSYTVTSSDIGSYLQLVATGTGNYIGKVSATTAEVPTTEIPIESVTLSTSAPQIGTTIAATVAPEGATASYQWYRGTSLSNMTIIGGATSSTYSVTSSDAGYYFRVVATGTGDYYGSASASTTTAVPATTIPLESITLSDMTPEVGETITTNLVPYGATVDYQWYRVTDTESSLIEGATGSSYMVTNEDVGYYLMVSATGTGNYSGNVFKLTSATVPDTEKVLKSISLSTGTPEVGVTVTTALLPVGSTASYQWYRGASSTEMTPIDGATSSFYAVTDADIGSFLKIVAVGTGDYSGSVSATTTSVVPEYVTELQSVTISDHTPEVGTTLVTTIDPARATATYQWYRGTSSTEMTPIEGASTPTYSVTTSDVGNYLKVVATGTGEYSGSVSDQTTSVVPEVLELDSITLSTVTPEVGTTITTTLLPSEATAGYQWYRGTSLAEMNPIDGATTSSYSVTTADVGNYLRVTAVGTGDYVGSVSASTTVVVPDVSDLVSISLSIYTPKAGDLLTTVLDPSWGTATYQWYRGISPSEMTPIAGATDSTYSVTNADIGYYLRVTATGTGNYGGSVSATTSSVAVSTKLSRPSFIKSETVAGATELTLYWDTIENASSYSIGYKTSDQTEWTTVTGIDASETSYTLTGLLPSRRYSVRIQAVGDGSAFLSSDYSIPMSVKTLKTDPIARLDSPVIDQTETVQKTDSLVITWNEVDDAIGYSVAYKAASDSFWTISENLPATTLSYTVSGLESGKSYQFKVMAIGDGISYKSSLYSETTTVKTLTTDLAQKLSAPIINVRESKASQNKVFLQWNENPNASIYALAWKEASSLEWKEIVGINRSNPKYLVSGLESDTAYDFKVKSIGDETNFLSSNYSDVVTIQTLSDEEASLVFSVSDDEDFWWVDV